MEIALGRKLYGLLLGALVSVVACKGEPYLAQINDGDVVKVLDAPRGHEWVVEKGGQKARLRLVGLYTFDTRTPETSLRNLAIDAQAFVGNLRGKQITVKLERKEPDPRGRYLAFAMQGEQDLGQAMIEQGLAALYTEYPFSRELSYIQTDTQARQKTLGLWHDDTAQTRLLALRKTWASVRERSLGSAVQDPLLLQPTANAKEQR